MVLLREVLEESWGSDANFILGSVVKTSKYLSDYWFKAILTLQLLWCFCQKATVLSKTFASFSLLLLLFLFDLIFIFSVWCWSSQQMPLPPLPFLRLAVIPSGFPLSGNHSLSQTPSGSRALGKMMGSHLPSEKKKNIFTVSEVWRCWVNMKKKHWKKRKKKERKTKAMVNHWLSNSELVAQLMCQ